VRVRPRACIQCTGVNTARPWRKVCVLQYLSPTPLIRYRLVLSTLPRSANLGSHSQHTFLQSSLVAPSGANFSILRKHLSLATRFVIWLQCPLFETNRGLKRELLQIFVNGNYSFSYDVETMSPPLNRTYLCLWLRSASSDVYEHHHFHIQDRRQYGCYACG
jgi:hypothetical protein